MSMTSTFDQPGHDIATAMQQAHAQLVEFISGQPDAEKILAETVRLCGQTLGAAGAGVWLTEQPEHPALILEHNLQPLELLRDEKPLPGLTLAVRRAVREAKPLIVPPFFTDADAADLPVNPTPYELLLAPLSLQGKVALVLVMAVRLVEDPSLHRTQISFLQQMIKVVEASLAQRHISLIEQDRGISAKVIRFAEQVHGHLFLDQTAADIANLTRDLLDSERVAVELYPGGVRKILAVSNVDEPNRRAQLLQAQRLIFDYVRDRNVPVVLDRTVARQLVSDPVLQDAATAYFAAASFEAFLAAPIRKDDKVIGVILAEFSDSPRAQQTSALLSDLARIASTSVTNSMEYEAIPLRRTLHAAAKLWRAPVSTRRYTVWTCTVLAVVLIVVVGIIPFDFSIKTDCALKPVAQLSIVAPMEGRIIDVPVHAGEHVYPQTAGTKAQPLMVFDTTDLLAQRAEQQQKQAELQVDLKSAQEKGDITKIGSVQAQIRQVGEQIKLLNQQIQQATVYSPFEGTVLTENVQQKKWSTVKLGEPVMEVASFKDWVLVVDVPESEVASVRQALRTSARRAAEAGKPDPGIEVEYIFYPWPDQRYAIRAKGAATLLPASLQSHNANVFRLQIPVRAEDLPQGIAISGVTGRAKVHIGSKPLLTQWTRGLRRLLKMTIGF